MYFIDSPEHTVDFDLMFCGEGPQGVVAGQKDRTRLAFGKHQSEAVMDREARSGLDYRLRA